MARVRPPCGHPPGAARIYETTEQRVTVLDGFEFRGEKYRSLSRIARLITGTTRNGFHFFFGRAGGTQGRPGTVSR